MARILVLGAYGLIGTACARAAEAAGHEVRRLGRSAAAARLAAPGADWVIADMARMDVADWHAATEGCDAVVNAAGALQDGGRDDLEAVHATAIDRLARALAGRGVRLVQISAVGASPDADTDFMRSKARGDAHVRAMDGPWVILRPGLVIGPAAYGGTALLRAAAALPVAPRPFACSPVQTVALDDVARAAVLGATGAVPPATEADLVEPAPRPLPEVIARLRAWLGLPPPRLALVPPGWTMALAGHVGDALSRLGWRPPLRTTALRVLADGVTGDPAPWRAAGGPDCRPLDATLAALPATVQERWFAKLWPLMPLAVAILSAFWTLSGLIALLRPEAAARVLTARGWPDGAAMAVVLGGAVLDVALGLAILWRPAARAACLGMAATAAAYLVGGTLGAPDLWADPLGPLTKVLPAIVLPLLTRALLEDR